MVLLIDLHRHPVPEIVGFQQGIANETTVGLAKAPDILALQI